MRYWGAITDNWWLITIEDGPRKGDVLSIGYWLPPQLEKVDPAKVEAGEPIKVAENVVAQKITRERAMSVLASMQIRAENNDMVRQVFPIDVNP